MNRTRHANGHGRFPLAATPPIKCMARLAFGRRRKGSTAGDSAAGMVEASIDTRYTHE